MSRQIVNTDSEIPRFQLQGHSGLPQNKRTEHLGPNHLIAPFATQKNELFLAGRDPERHWLDNIPRDLCE